MGLPVAPLAQALSLFITTMQGVPSPAIAAGRWARAVEYLQQELHRLRAFSDAAHQDPAGMKSLAVRLTQLARTLDGLGVPPVGPGERLVAQQRSVVFAAWRLAQALEQQPATPAAR